MKFLKSVLMITFIAYGGANASQTTPTTQSCGSAAADLAVSTAQLGLAAGTCVALAYSAHQLYKIVKSYMKNDREAEGELNYNSLRWGKFGLGLIATTCFALASLRILGSSQHIQPS